MVNKFIVLLMLLGMNAVASAETLNGVMLKYMVSEAGMEPYPSRIIVTEKMVRMDDDDAKGDYLLFDREKQLISSVTHDDGTVFEIALHDLPPASPVAMERKQTLQADNKAPSVGGRQPHQLQLFVNGDLCFDAVVVPGLLPDTLQALRAFNRVLAGEQGKLVDELPEEMISGCDLALHTFHPEWMLESGLAIQEFDLTNRRGRVMVDMDPEFKVDSMLLQLPAGYKHYSTVE